MRSPRNPVRFNPCNPRHRPSPPGWLWYGRRRGGHADLRAGFRDPLQLPSKVACCLPPTVRVLGEACLHDMVQRGRGHGFKRGHRCRVMLEDLGDEASLTLPLERLLTRDHLVDHGPERKDVRPGVSLLAFELLWGHVLESAEDGARTGERGADGGRRAETHSPRRTRWGAVSQTRSRAASRPSWSA